MNKTLEALWYGNIHFSNECDGDTRETKKLMTYLNHHREHLRATLTDEQKEILDKYDDCHAELASINECDIFVYGFRLGAKIAIEVMSLELD